MTEREKVVRPSPIKQRAERCRRRLSTDYLIDALRRETRDTKLMRGDMSCSFPSAVAVVVGLVGPKNAIVRELRRAPVSTLTMLSA